MKFPIQQVTSSFISQQAVEQIMTKLSSHNHIITIVVIEEQWFY